MKNIVNKIVYTKVTRYEYIYDIDFFINSIRRTLEQEMSCAWNYCSDIKFIYRITPEMVIDFLNYKTDKCKDIFEDIEFKSTLNNRMTIIDVIQDTILDVYDKYVEVDEDALDWTDYSFKLEEDDES